MLADNKLTWINSLYDVNLYPININEYGGLEFEIVFKQNPLYTSLRFPIEYNNLEFYYQQALTPEEIKDGYYRPENVINSYAVYHSYLRDNEYLTGKAFHIYRPKLIDSMGLESWCNINIDTKTNLMSISWDRSFMDNAIYPVILDPSFGYTSIGASAGGLGGVNKKRGCNATLTENGDITFINFYGRDGGIILDIDVGIYNDSGGSPNNLDASNVGVDFSDGNAWNQFALSVSETTGTYWLSYIVSGVGVNVYYDNVGNSRTNYNTDSPPFDVTWGADNWATQLYSIYCNYTATGGITTLTYRPNETLTINDNFSYKGTFSFFDTLTIDDSFTSFFDYILLSLSETLLISDDILTSIGGQILLTLLETITIGDSLTSILPIQIGLTFYHYYVFLAILTFLGVFFVSTSSESRNSNAVKKMISCLCFLGCVSIILTYSGLPLGLIAIMSAIYSSLSVASLLIGIEIMWKKPESQNEII